MNSEPKVGPELVIGLVTPIGTSTSALATNLCARLSEYDYRTLVIRLTDHLPDPPEPGTFETEDQRVRRLIAAGNAFCREHADQPAGPAHDQARDPAAAMARLAVREIVRRRVAERRLLGDTDPVRTGSSLQRTAYVIHSLKRPAEVALLREVYGDAFVLLGSQATPAQRLSNLENRPLSQSDPAKRSELARELMLLDADEGDKLGQQVNDTYPLADFFLSDTDTKRLVDLLFGRPIAPTIDEFAMYVARASRARSLAASRKVGAAIVVGDAVVATGYNDAPWGETPDVQQGIDTSELLKRGNVEDTLARLRDAGLLADAVTPHEALAKALATLKGGKQLSVIEYQRAVHAEAKAIDDATVRGVSPTGGTLFVTTFPCHLCFKHALSVRLEAVVYIEPYAKSRAEIMYPDGGASRLRPYSGVAPDRYMRIFDDRPAFEAEPSGKFVETPPHVVQPLVGGVVDDEERFVKERLALSELKEEYR